MTLQDIIQIKQDRMKGVMLCRSTIDRLIDYALAMASIQANKEKHMHTIESLVTALQEQTELAEKLRQQAETLEEERDRYKLALEDMQGRVIPAQMGTIADDSIFGELAMDYRGAWMTINHNSPQVAYERLVAHIDAHTAAVAAKAAAAKQAEIDRLMLEYCPNEMTADQMSEREARQRKVVGGDVPKTTVTTTRYKLGDASAPQQHAQAALSDEPLAVLTLGGIEDGSEPEFEENDIVLNTKAVEALQQQLVTFQKNRHGLSIELFAAASQQPAAAPAAPEWTAEDQREQAYFDRHPDIAAPAVEAGQRVTIDGPTFRALPQLRILNKNSMDALIAYVDAALAPQASKGAVPYGWINAGTDQQQTTYATLNVGAENPWVDGANAFPVYRAAQAQPVASQRPSDDDLWDQTLRERDYNAEIADKLADAIGEHLGRDVGEHSSGHCPWLAALEMLNETQPVADAAQTWIDFSDAVPKEGQHVLICGPMPFDVQSVFKGWRTCARYMGGDLLDGNGCTRNSATHWMPMADSFADCALAAKPAEGV